MIELKLDHIIYTLIPYKGYGVRAWSNKGVITDVERAFKGWFSPYDQAYVKPGAELRAVVKDLKDNLYLSRVFVGERLDELKRSGVVSHIAVVPLKHLMETGLSLEELDKALINFINSRGIEIGDIPPLMIPLERKPDVDQDLNYFKTVVSRDEARKLLEGVTKPYGKVVVIYKKDVWSRIRLAYSVSKVLAIHGLGEYIVLTEKPLDNILIEFENAVLVLDKMIPLKQTKEWTVVKISESEKERKEPDVEQTLRRIYEGS